jgi:diguanylate cyclase (GGDEF)-like protein
MNSPFLLLISAFFVLALAAAIYFYWKNKKISQERSRLKSELEETQVRLAAAGDENQQKLIHLGLLDEISSSIAESMNEAEIFQLTVTGVVMKLGYAEAAISLLVEGGQLEITAIDGQEDIGYRSGFRQKMGEGIIGHTAETREIYRSNEIAVDPYYFTIGNRNGSAVSIPMLSEGQLLGVLYVESTRLHAFTQDDIQTLTTLVRHTVTAMLKARLYARSQANVRAMLTLMSVSQSILSSLELKQVYQSVVQLLRESFSYTYTSIYTLHGDVLKLEAESGYLGSMVIREIPASKGVCGRCVQTKQIQYVHNVSHDPDFLRADFDIDSEICIPLIKDDRVLGVLNVEAVSGASLTEDDVVLLTAMAGNVVVAMENGSLHNEVKRLALTDGLTNIANRRAFDQVIEKELSRAERYKHSTSLIIIDMDCFKEYNDREGHPAGDERLKAVARLLKSNLRNPDFIARYGGEEFAIILPNTSKANSTVMAERLRIEAENQAPAGNRKTEWIPGYTVSMGIATYPEDGETVEKIILAADRAELTAKKLGKNRVAAAGQ